MRRRRPGGVAADTPQTPDRPAPRDTAEPEKGEPETAGPLEARRLLHLGTAAAVVTMAVTSTGDVLVVGVLLGLLAADAIVGVTAVVAGMATLVRWGSSSLGALAGGQAVLGAAGFTGAWPSVLSSWAAAVALVLVCPRGRAAPLAFGLVAASLVAGPALGGGSVADAVVRLAASTVGVAAAAFAARRVRRSLARPAGLELAALAALVLLAPHP